MSLEVMDDWEDLDSPEEEDFTDVLLTPVLASERSALECKPDELEEYQLIDWPYAEHSLGSPNISPVQTYRPSKDDFRKRKLPPLPKTAVVPAHELPPRRCYAPTCGLQEGRDACYSYACRQSAGRSKNFRSEAIGRPFRERFIKKIISNEKKYVELLDFVDSDIVKPLYFVKPPILSSSCLNDLMELSFSNIIAMSRCHHSHLDALSDRCYAVGDIFLDLVETLQPLYLDYVSKLGNATRMLGSQRKVNSAFSLFCFLVGERLILRTQGSPRDIDNLLQLPFRHLQTFEAMLSDLLLVTPDSHPDIPHLTRAIEMVRNMLFVSATPSL